MVQLVSSESKEENSVIFVSDGGRGAFDLAFRLKDNKNYKSSGLNQHIIWILEECMQNSGF